MEWPAAERLVRMLGPDGGRDLLRVLQSSDDVRADVIRQLWERASVSVGAEEIAELLMLFEEKEWARQAMTEELRRMKLGSTDG